ncbi:protein kinase [Histomonas meleagridis]|uniref:protein kinase n=1 Tax=Histomonas meleagridis TaxID=135588 RepID=UPI003559601D|nr:protein kinase [Histomonas meleagridis]KAH0800403.1 protein kinase [Histomonas meleagridis]
MGAGLSTKYENIEHQFDIGIWKVHKAHTKEHHEPVSLWIIDYALMKQKERNKKHRRAYLQHCVNSLQIMTKIQHKNILEIKEISNVSKKLGFASERIDKPLSAIKGYSRDEAIYISQQLAITLNELQTNFHYSFLGITPSSVFLTKHFTLKLGLFLHAVPITNNTSTIKDPFCPWSSNSIYHVPANYCAPEIIEGKPITPQADSYMYALTCIYIFTGKSPSNITSSSDLDTNIALSACQNLPSEFSDLMKNCLSTTPSTRPSFEGIVSNPAFSSLICEVFRYVENIATKDMRDLYNFFTGLKGIIKIFSFRMLHSKFLPIFIFYLKKDVRFSYILMPMLFSMQSKFNDEELLNELIAPLEPVLGISDPPKIPEILLQYIGVLIRRIPKSKHPKLVYPIINGALKCKENSVVNHCLDIIPYMINIMDGTNIRQILCDGLINMLNTTQNPEFVNKIIKLFIMISKKIGAEYIGTSIINHIQKVWNKNHWNSITEAIVDLLYSLEVSENILLQKNIPLALSILNEKIPNNVRNRIFVYIMKAMKKIQNEYHISNDDINEAERYQMPDYSLPTQPIPEPNDDSEYSSSEYESESEENDENETQSQQSSDLLGSFDQQSQPQNARQSSVNNQTDLLGSFSQQNSFNNQSRNSSKQSSVNSQTDLFASSNKQNQSQSSRQSSVNNQTDIFNSVGQRTPQSSRQSSVNNQTNTFGSFSTQNQTQNSLSNQGSRQSSVNNQTDLFNSVGQRTPQSSRQSSVNNQKDIFNSFSSQNHSQSSFSNQSSRQSSVNNQTDLFSSQQHRYQQTDPFTLSQQESNQQDSFSIFASQQKPLSTVNTSSQRSQPSQSKNIKISNFDGFEFE